MITKEENLEIDQDLSTKPMSSQTFRSLFLKAPKIYTGNLKQICFNKKGKKKCFINEQA
jgi:hypothetical protein